MTLLDWVRIAIATAVFATWWIFAVWGVLQWQDLHYDQVKARQKAMGRWKWKVTNWIGGKNDQQAEARASLIRWGGAAIGLVLFYVTYRATFAIGGAAAVVLLVNWTRRKKPDTEEIRNLRVALGQLIGLDEQGQPPRVTPDGEHPEGGPARITIGGHPKFRDWNKKRQEEVQHVIQSRLVGTWGNVEWRGNGASVWERLPELPTLVTYTQHLDLPWYQIPIGVTGLTDRPVAVMDLTERFHWLIAGDSGEGKTTLMGVAGTHLLHHRNDVQVALIDTKGIGLHRFVGREGVTLAAINDYDLIEQAVAQLYDELYARKAEHAQTGKFRKPLVILFDELEETLAEAAALGTRIGGGKGGELQIVAHLLAIARLGREFDMHLICATQRPDGTSLPTKLRAQLKGRVIVGPINDQKGAEIAVGADWPWVANMPGIPGRDFVKARDWKGYAQGYNLANPRNSKHKQTDRNDAERLLPPEVDVRVSDSDAHSPAESDESVRIEDWSKRELSAGSSPAASAAPLRRNGGSVPRTAAEILRDQRDRKAASERARVARLREAMARDPLHEKHGTPQGHRICPCKWCKTLTRPNLVEVSQ